MNYEHLTKLAAAPVSPEKFHQAMLQLIKNTVRAPFRGAATVGQAATSITPDKFHQAMLDLIRNTPRAQYLREQGMKNKAILAALGLGTVGGGVGGGYLINKLLD